MAIKFDRNGESNVFEHQGLRVFLRDLRVADPGQADERPVYLATERGGEPTGRDGQYLRYRSRAEAIRALTPTA